MLYRVAKFHDKTRTVSDRGALLATYETKTQTLRDLPYTTTKASLPEKQNEKKPAKTKAKTPREHEIVMVVFCASTPEVAVGLCTRRPTGRINLHRRQRCHSRPVRLIILPCDDTENIPRE